MIMTSKDIQSSLCDQVAVGDQLDVLFAESFVGDLAIEIFARLPFLDSDLNF